MQKKEKVEFVNKLKKDLKNYKTCAVMEIGSTPDRLVQKVRNQLKPEAKFVVARKTLLVRALSEDQALKKLVEYTNGNVALILTNNDPSELNKVISSNRIKLAAKPNQISPEDINISAGETSIAPGQAVTDLKAAGIDVKIDKGKVVIAKSKVLVAKGARVTVPVSKALKMLDIMPFEASTKLRAALSDNLLFTEKALGVNRAFVEGNITADFLNAQALSTAIGFVTPYNAPYLIKKAYISAIGLGVSRGIYEPEIIEKLLAKAVMEAVQASRVVKTAETDAAKPAGNAT
ncbi:MAG: 50S ribosomal protein L10 [Candidatus Micrarchaeaceae archaeon]